MRHDIAAAAFLCVILALDGIVESYDPGQAVIGYDRFLKADEAGQQSGMRRGRPRSGRSPRRLEKALTEFEAKRTAADPGYRIPANTPPTVSLSRHGATRVWRTGLSAHHGAAQHRFHCAGARASEGQQRFARWRVWHPTAR